MRQLRALLLGVTLAACQPVPSPVGAAQSPSVAPEEGVAAPSAATAPRLAPTDAETPSTAPHATAPRATAPLETAAPREAVSAFTRATSGEVEFRVRSSLPAAPVIDGAIDEWLDASASQSGSTVILTFTPTRFFVAFDVPLEPTASFGLRLPGAELPDIGMIVRGGGTYNVDCDHTPWDPDGKVSAASRKQCLAISRRYEALKAKQAARFQTSFPLAENDTSNVAAAARSCRQENERLRCEAEYSLLRLPRTNAVELDVVDLRVESGPASSAEWQALSLPQPVGFAEGLALRRLVMPPTDWVLPEHDRYSYQPGEALDYEVAARQGGQGLGMADVGLTSCRLSAVIASIGRADVRRSCANGGSGILYVDGAPIEAFSLPTNTRFIQRAGQLLMVSESREYAFELGYDVHSFYVQRLLPDGTWQEAQTIYLTSDGCRSLRGSHDADFKRMDLTCTPPAGARTPARSLSLVWSEQTGSYEERRY